MNPVADYIATSQPIKFLQPTMRQNHSNYSAPINLQSPIGLMPFGKHKGEVLWTLGIGTLSWMSSNYNLTDIGKQTLLDAAEMGNHRGEWAVLRAFKDYILLQGFYSSFLIASTHVNTTEDFVYHIVEPKI